MIKTLPCFLHLSFLFFFLFLFFLKHLGANVLKRKGKGKRREKAVHNIDRARKGLFVEMTYEQGPEKNN